MSVDRNRAGELWVLMQARRLGIGRNPLRRRVDRLESMILACAILVALLMIPIAAALGTAVRNSSENSAAQRRAVLTQVQARTLENTETAVPTAPGQVTSRVRVTWIDQAGWPQEGHTNVAIGTKKDTEVTIWLDSSGAITAPPRPPGDSAAIGGAAGVTVAIMSWLLIAGLARLAVVPLNRRRMRDWEREWEQVAARWRQSQG
ncbi:MULTISPECIES: Rv1733c family protein [unclassified Kribbella]|uniref:Rv1733c family protein n=1 Tax=unclassified Kribbella TaxID=2644121 RepID=UPI0030165554